MYLLSINNSDNVEYILKKYNEFKVDNGVRNYLYDIGPLFVGKKINTDK